MKKHNLVLITALIVISLLAAACSIKTETTESVTDAKGNTTTTTTKSDNGNVTTETTTSSTDDSEEEESDAADEQEEGDSEESSQNLDTPEAVSSFVDALGSAITEQESALTLNEPENMGEGKYAIPTNSDGIEFSVQTDGSNAQSYTVAIMGDDTGTIMVNYAIFIIAMLDGDEEQVTGEAILGRGESPVETEAYTFRAITGEIGGQSFSTLTAIVK